MKSYMILLSFCVNFAYCQNFDEGFKYLETGKFSDAASFFKKYLNTYDSTNKTALLCYGRGVGLSNSPIEAQRVFKALLNKYPTDLEIQLNWAESLMWNKQFSEAQRYYEFILIKNPTNFNSLVGSANAFSSLLQFDKALKMIERANKIDPQNENLKITRKYARLGRAGQLAQQQGYTEALKLLESIFQDFPNDIDALFLKAQVFGFKQDYNKAQVIFQRLLNTPKKTDAYIQLAYLLFLQKKSKKALLLAEKAYLSAPYTEKTKAFIGKINALGWNNRFKEAFSNLTKLEKKEPKNPEITLLKARLSVWGKNYQKGVEYYQKAIRENPKSFDANLGYADAKHAQGMDKQAFEYAYKTLKFYPKQVDTQRFLEKLRLAHDPSIESTYFVSKDNGKNTSSNHHLKIGYDLTPQYRVFSNYKKREMGSVLKWNQAKVQNLSIGVLAKPIYFVGIEAELNQVTAETENQRNQQINYMFSTEWRLGRWQQLTLKQNKETQTFVPDFIKNKLTYTNTSFNYSLNTPFQIGVYSQAIHSNISDGNKRNLAFLSLYYDFLYQPVIKAGFNYQYLGFKRGVNELYFSPIKYQGLDIFVQSENLTMSKQRLLYQGTIAFGVQKIEEKIVQSTYRINFLIGYRHKERIELKTYFNRSNIATTTAAGYTYNELGINAKWILPILRDF